MTRRRVSNIFLSAEQQNLGIRRPGTPHTPDTLKTQPRAVAQPGERRLCTAGVRGLRPPRLHQHNDSSDALRRQRSQ